MSLAAADALMGVFGYRRLILKPRKCAQCRQVFTPSLNGQKVCGVECAKTIAKNRRLKAERQADKIKRESLKSRAQWIKETQNACNAYVRARDEKQNHPCISCGKHHAGQNHAGHYLSTGARPELRFEADLNIHLQCAPCNTYLHGNLILYRVNLIEKIGIGNVEWLEGNHPPKHYSIDDLKAMKAEFKAKTKELKHGL